MGHIRDLPEGAKEVPEEYRKHPSGRLGVHVEHQFQPLYIIPRDKQKQVRRLKSALKDAQRLYLATDEDREGEAISWHLCEVLHPKIPVHRLVFHEITRESILEALGSPRDIDLRLVRAQEARRILDRLFGYEVSPLLWRKVGPRLSAGRVQSVAVRLVVGRERQRMAFRSATFWDLVGQFRKEGSEPFQAALVSVGGRRIPQGRDFDPATGSLKDSTLLWLDEAAARNLCDRLRGREVRVLEVEQKPFILRPAPPFTTSTLQQEANRKFGFSARYTMQLAQSLYENGHITYMRTDSTQLAAVAVEAAREIIRQHYGLEYLPREARVYRTRVRNAQEAHEAIRPAGHPFTAPEDLRSVLSADEWRVYELIWKRTIASQMVDARGYRVSVALGIEDSRFEVVGRTIEFAGYLRAYVEGTDESDVEAAEPQAVLPLLRPGEAVECLTLEPKSHTTQPPPRYSEATLIRCLEEMGIGRPSTYATIIDTILSRNYVFKRGSSLVPTWLGMAVTQLLEEHLAELVDYQFTAQMEEELDAISRGELDHVAYLAKFYYGNDHPGLKKLLEEKLAELRAADVNRMLIGQPEGSGPQSAPIYVRIGRFGPYIEQGARRAPLPKNLAPDELTVDKALELFTQAEQEEQPIGYCPKTGKPIYLRTGRYGPYIQRGDATDGQKPEQVSLLRGMKPEEVTLDLALKLLALPRDLGVHPETGDRVLIHNGRFGPFVECGKQTRSLPADVSPFEITLEQALALLAAPKTFRRRRSSEPIRTFPEGPNGEPAIRVMNGRYGPYVTDGTINASIPRELSPEEITESQARNLLLQRASQPPSSPGRRRRSQSVAARSSKGNNSVE